MVLKQIDYFESLKQAFLAALLTLGLTFLIFGVRTAQQMGGLSFELRWQWVITAMVIVFLGRFLLATYWQWQRLQHPLSSPEHSYFPRLSLTPQFWHRTHFILGLVLIIVALLFPLSPLASRYYLDIAVLVLTYIMLGWGLNIVVGLAGLLDLGYVAFYAMGAYSFALLAMHFDWTFWMALPIAGLLGASLGVLLGYPVLRLRGDYLAIVTLGLGEIIRIILLNWYTFTGGPNGISNIPRPTFFGLEFSRTASDGGHTFHSFFGLDFDVMHRLIFLYYVILILALMTNFFTLRIRKLPIGRAWEALREDEIACRSLGINPVNTKLTAFGIGAMFGGFAGAFFATRQGFVSPESFTFIESAIILAIVVLGGMGRQMGVVIAAVLLIGATELFRGLAEYRMVAFGAGMVAIMVWRPRGLLAHREPTIRLYPHHHQITPLSETK
ncbi:branched-chain amino acid ABC transporter permease [Thioflexithrix psekupsensis]|uniref:Branched-chain amino acid ABC transporter permease n=2 Tax=Thioflexithrix psekupsensis TaxID=1570016 RepID=A0A251X5I7_9GAMM|nr:branched-chain amino acid ABC transporter permease [Thioflexithrix psekupsensis]